MKNVLKAVVLSGITLVSTVSLAECWTDENGQTRCSAAAPPAVPGPGPGFPQLGNIHQSNASALGLNYTWAYNNFGGIDGLVVTQPYGFRLSGYTGWCPLGLEAGDKIIQINGVQLINEYAVSNAIQNTRYTGFASVSFVNIRSGAYETRACQGAL
jgi:hypothetical protein